MRLLQPALLALAFTPTLPAGAPGLALETWVYTLDGAFGQSPQPSTAPTLQVYSRETIVDVTLTDSKGNPVHGLTRDDFTVKEDNKPQPIHSFQEFRAHSSDDAAPNLPPNTYANRQPPPASDAVNIFLLDFLNSAPDIPPDVYNGPQLNANGLAPLNVAIARQHLMKVDATKYLQSMPTGTRVALLGMFQPGSLHVLQGVISDPVLLSASIDATHYGTQSIANNHESWCSQQESRNRSTIEAFTQIAADLAAIKGRKNLIWFNVGLATITDGAQRPSCLTDYSKDLQKAYALLAAAQVAIFPVSVRGVETPTASEAAAVLSMESVAEATGGAAYYQNNDIAALVAQAVDRGANYYTLSYIPPGQKYDYSHHTINISVDKPGLHLVYRQSYDAVDPASIKPTPGLVLANAETAPASSRPDLDAEMKSAMGRAMPTSTQLIFKVFVEPAPAGPPNAAHTILGTLDPKLNGKLLSRYSFSYTFPARLLAFSSDPDGSYHGAVELDIAAYDPDGKLVTGLSQTVTMPLKNPAYQQFIQGPFNFLQQLDLPPGALFLRIGVLDRTANKIGTLEIPLTVPKK